MSRTRKAPKRPAGVTDEQIAARRERSNRTAAIRVLEGEKVLLTRILAALKAGKKLTRKQRELCAKHGINAR